MRIVSLPGITSKNRTRGEHATRWKERIATNPAVLAGKPLVAGTRIAVELLLDCLAGGWSINQIVDAYPHIAPEDVLAALAFSADVLRRKPYITVSEVEASAEIE